MNDYKKLVSAIRCSATSYSGCTADCPYRLLEEIKSDFPVPADVVVDGVGYWVSCDCDKMSLDAADAIEQLVKERNALKGHLKLMQDCERHKAFVDEVLTIDDKLTYIKSNCQAQAACNGCRLTLGRTCPEKLWKDWTPEEIETAFNIIYGGEIDDAEE